MIGIAWGRPLRVPILVPHFFEHFFHVLESENSNAQRHQGKETKPDNNNDQPELCPSVHHFPLFVFGSRVSSLPRGA